MTKRERYTITNMDGDELCKVNATAHMAPCLHHDPGCVCCHCEEGVMKNSPSSTSAARPTMTLAQWKRAGGCGISHYAQAEAQRAFAEPEVLFERRPLSELCSVAIIARELGRFRAEHSDQLSRTAFAQTAAIVDPEHESCYRLVL